MKLFAILPLLCSTAVAQPCLPASDTPSESHIWTQPSQNINWIGTPLEWGLTKNGGWVRWYCAELNGSGFVKVTRVSTLADLPNAGGRIKTIISADDPLKSLQTAPNRIKILPLSDPSLAAIVADMEPAK